MLPHDFLWFLIEVDKPFVWHVCSRSPTWYFLVSSLRYNSLTFSSPPSDLQSQNASKSEDQSELVSRLKSLELDNKILHKGTYYKTQTDMMAVPQSNELPT